MNIVKILFKQHRFLNTITILISVFFFSLLYVLVINIYRAEIDMDTARNFKNKNVYQISDDLIGEREMNFFKSKKSYEILSNFNNTLAASNDFMNYSAAWQPVYVGSFKGDERFDPYYESGRQPNVPQLHGQPFFPVQSVQVNHPVFDMNNLQFSLGHGFSEDDYIFHSNTDFLPVILGNDYKAYYRLGDSMDIYLYSKVFKGKVIGFLESSQTIFTANEPELAVDKYVILPAQMYTNSPLQGLWKVPDHRLFIRASLLARLNSLIITEQTPLEARQSLSTVSTKTGFFDYQLIGANGFMIDALVHMTESNLSLIIVYIVILFFITITAIIVTLAFKINKNIDVYTVLLISGAGMKHIEKYIGNEILLLFLAGVSVPITPFLLMTGGSTDILFMYLLISMIFIAVIFALGKKYSSKLLSNINIVQRLKG